MMVKSGLSIIAVDIGVPEWSRQLKKHALLGDWFAHTTSGRMGAMGITKKESEN
jgi:hypothetical protein